MFSDHNGVKLQFNNKKITIKSPKTWQLNNVWIKEGNWKRF